MEKIRTAIANLKDGKSEEEGNSFIASLGSEFQLGLSNAYLEINDKLINAVNDNEVLTESQKTAFLSDIS